MTKKLKNQLEELELHIKTGDVLNKKVSKVGSYWHIDHTLRVISGIPQALKDSNPASFKPHFNFTKLIIMTLNKIPRGKGRAPKHVLPQEHITQKELLEKIEISKNGLNSLATLNSNHHFNHPLFGHLNLKESQKFLGIHTDHHLKIIRDILKKK